MTILLLGSYRPELIEIIASFGDQVINIENNIKYNYNTLENIEFIVSYGYRYILNQDVLDKFPNKAINIHISLLPWNRGADPNLWSFLENTPKGVTIHHMDCGVDTGEILVQEKVNFSTDETLRTSYEKLSIVAQELFRRYWLDIREGRIKSHPQPNWGSYHLLRDRVQYEYLLTKGWDTPVCELIGKALKRS
ncbi:formyl transferase [Nostoc sp. 'Peltigera membranacea cyanobiont' 210A]|uniref:formyltransferase family protein n=1 Tax=Nostoc sp. 'Peltigera membranacea cyanobiont' 210A TaxID=2014529 RepID=UPI000B957C84|nr:formyltransferase family protein [Nostoc sp. 'Peltigera membranacea cyanobiont' 210A]OYD97819.1 formyl transferase [Nostoc sp. 'Peltigera membranacea cyanobiont' 210A]